MINSSVNLSVLCMYHSTSLPFPHLHHITVCHSGTEDWDVSRSIPFISITPNKFYLQIFIPMHHQDSWCPLVSSTMSVLNTHKDSLKSCCCPESWGSCSYGSTGPVPFMLSSSSYGEAIVVDQLKDLSQGLGHIWAAQPVSFPAFTPPHPAPHLRS